MSWVSNLSLSNKLLVAAFVAGIINQTSTFIVLYLTKQPIYGMLWLNLFGSIIGYITNSYVYGIHHIVWEMFLRWTIITCLTLFLTIKLYKYIEDIEIIKKWKKELSGFNLTIFNYLLILATTWVIFIVWIYVMTTDYVFVYRKGKIINYIDILILCTTILIVGIDQYLTKIYINQDKIQDKIQDK